MRAVLVLCLVLAPALAGCSAPGVNEDAYPGYVPGPPSPPPAALPDHRSFAEAMRDEARVRPPLPGEAAYDRYLEAATAWARDGVGEADAAWPFPEGDEEAESALRALASLSDAERGSDREVFAPAAVRQALAARWRLDEPGRDAGEAARELLDAATEEVAAANASVHDARLRLPRESRDALLRAEAVLGVAFTNLATAERALASGQQDAAAAALALDARVGAAGVRFWLAEAEAAAPEGAPAMRWPDDLPARTALLVAEAEAAMARGRNGSALAHVAIADVPFGLALVAALERAGLPEGAWAASQGLRENVLVIDLAIGPTVPRPPEVEEAWARAADHVRTYRDAQRYDRAHATATDPEGPTAVGGGARLLELLRAYASLALMREITVERDDALRG